MVLEKVHSPPSLKLSGLRYSLFKRNELSLDSY